MTIAIIGAGMTGLAAAHRLSRLKREVVVYEAADRAGGLASGFRAPGWDWHLDRFYHHWFTSDYEVLRLAREIGRRGEVFFPRAVTSIWLAGEARPSDTPWRLLSLPGVGAARALRAGLTLALLRCRPQGRSLERWSAASWLSRWMGRRAYEAIWKPLLEGKFGRYAEDVNMAWFWARVRKRSRRLGYFTGGFQAFADAVAAAVEAQGGRIRLRCPVHRIDRRPDGSFDIVHEGGKTRHDKVLSTVPPPVMLALAPGLPPAYGKQIAGLKVLGAVTLVLSLERNLTERHYWINLPKSEGFPFLVLVEHTNFVSPRHYGGDHLVYCGDYIETDHPSFRLGEAETVERFAPALARINGDFNRGWIKQTWLFRSEHAQPVPVVGYSRRVPPMKTPIPGLFWAWMTHVYPWDRGTNYAVALGRKAADKIGGTARGPVARRP